MGSPKSWVRLILGVCNAKGGGFRGSAGIVVGTLGVAGYMEAVEGVRKLAQAAGKKTYTILMGKPSPAKLANFPEVEVFVLVADPQVAPRSPRPSPQGLSLDSE